MEQSIRIELDKLNARVAELEEKQPKLEEKKKTKK